MNEHTGSSQGDPIEYDLPSDQHRRQAIGGQDAVPEGQPGDEPTIDDPRFGGWIVCEISDTDVLNSMRDATVDGVLTMQMYNDSPKRVVSASNIFQRFGSWRKACDMIHVRTGRMDLGLSDEQLFENIRQIWIHKGSCPTGIDMSKSRIHQAPDGSTYTSVFSFGGYTHRFESWEKTQIGFQAWYVRVYNDQPLPASREPAEYTETKPGRLTVKQRQEILERDDWTCQWPGCGRSRHTDPGIQLHVDHRLPRSQGGTNDPSNLQVLCATHNCGKGKRLTVPETDE